jgi:hypothetical protein
LVFRGEKNNKEIVVFKNVTNNISDYFRLTSVSIFSTLYDKILWQEEKIEITHRHRYLWTGPPLLFFISSIRVDPGPRNRGPTATSLLALKIRTTVANTGKLRSIGQVPVLFSCKQHFATLYASLDPVIPQGLKKRKYK